MKFPTTFSMYLLFASTTMVLQTTAFTTLFPASKGTTTTTLAPQTTTTTTTTTTTLHATSNHNNKHKKEPMMTLKDSNLRQLLYRCDKPLLINASATWCGPCKLIQPLMEQYAKDNQGSLNVVKYNVEGPNPETRIELLLQGARPQSLPSLFLMYKGKLLNTHAGVISKEELEDFVQSNLEHHNIIETNKAESQKSGFVSLAAQQHQDDYMLSQAYL